MGEILEDAGISWKVYMELDNFDDNGFAWFEQYRKALPGNPLFDKGMVRYLNVTHKFSKDFEKGEIP
jgi:phospholipase C